MNVLAMASLAGLLATGQSSTDPTLDPQAQEMVNQIFAPMIEQAVNSMGRQMEMSKRLNNQIVAEVDFQGASLDDVVTYIRSVSKDLDENRQPLNIIVHPDAAKLAQGRKVDLKLTHVPVGAVLNYSLTMLGLGYRVDEHAIMVVPPQTAAATAATDVTGTVPAQQPVRPK